VQGAKCPRPCSRNHGWLDNLLALDRNCERDRQDGCFLMEGNARQRRSYPRSYVGGSKSRPDGALHGPTTIAASRAEHLAPGLFDQCRIHEAVTTITIMAMLLVETTHAYRAHWPDVKLTMSGRVTDCIGWPAAFIRLWRFSCSKRLAERFSAGRRAV